MSLSGILCRLALLAVFVTFLVVAAVTSPAALIGGLAFLAWLAVFVFAVCITSMNRRCEEWADAWLDAPESRRYDGGMR
jgi:hypothetical protein